MSCLQGLFFPSGPVEAAQGITRRTTEQIYLVSSFRMIEPLSGESLISSKRMTRGDKGRFNWRECRRKSERPAGVCRAFSGRVCQTSLFARFPTGRLGHGLSRGNANLVSRKIDDPRAVRGRCIRAKRRTGAGPCAADNRAHRLLVEFHAVG